MCAHVRRARLSVTNDIINFPVEGGHECSTDWPR